MASTSRASPRSDTSVWYISSGEDDDSSDDYFEIVSINGVPAGGDAPMRYASVPTRVKTELAGKKATVRAKVEQDRGVGSSKQSARTPVEENRGVGSSRGARGDPARRNGDLPLGSLANGTRQRQLDKRDRPKLLASPVPQASKRRRVSYVQDDSDGDNAIAELLVPTRELVGARRRPPQRLAPPTPPRRRAARISLMQSDRSGTEDEDEDDEGDKNEDSIEAQPQPAAPVTPAPTAPEQAAAELATGGAPATTSCGMPCGCCFDDEIAWEDMVQCPNAHIFCKTCARRAAEEQLAMRLTVLKCMDGDGCDACFTESEIKRYLPEPSYQLLHRIRQEREVDEAAIEGLQKCPFCPYAEVVEDPNETVLRCLNESCQRASCLKCKKADHSPNGCEEDVSEEGARRRAEELLAETLMRRCAGCQTPIIKSEGCNKVTCTVCRTLTCYVCRADVTREGYQHFGEAAAGKCPLFEDTDARHEFELEEARKKIGAAAPARGLGDPVVTRAAGEAAAPAQADAAGGRGYFPVQPGQAGAGARGQCHCVRCMAEAAGLIPVAFPPQDPAAIAAIREAARAAQVAAREAAALQEARMRAARAAADARRRENERITGGAQTRGAQSFPKRRWR